MNKVLCTRQDDPDHPQSQTTTIPRLLLRRSSIYITSLYVQRAFHPCWRLILITSQKAQFIHIYPIYAKMTHFVAYYKLKNIVIYK